MHLLWQIHLYPPYFHPEGVGFTLWETPSLEILQMVEMFIILTMSILHVWCPYNLLWINLEEYITLLERTMVDTITFDGLQSLNTNLSQEHGIRHCNPNPLFWTQLIYHIFWY
jgi:hypothetical protein